MTARDFCYWLQGFIEIRDAAEGDAPTLALNAKQLDVIRRHLALVFVHDLDPKAGGPDVQEKLNKIHAVATASEVPTGFPAGLGKKMPDGSVARC